MAAETGPDVFARATTRLVVLFTAIVVLIVVASGVIMYLNVKTNITDVAGGGGGGGSGGGETEIERELASRSISSLRWQLVALDGAIVVAVGALGLWYARRTLRPIRELYGAQKRFVADASHELRTPLAIMRADFEVALRDEARAPADAGQRGATRGPDTGRRDEVGLPSTAGQLPVAVTPADAGQRGELREALQSGLEEVDRMTAIVDDLLTASRIDAHQEELRFAPVDLAELVRRTAEGMRTMGERAHVAVAVTAPWGAVTATADAAHLERALRNIVRNAVEHSSAGDRVEVTLAAAGESAEVRVTDEGTGIAPADLEHVFDRFYRADSSRSHDRGGAGLGLAIARWIVERHGGAITAESRPGQGTTIAFRLPLAGPRE